MIDDYVKQGQSAARMMWGPLLGGGASRSTDDPNSEDMQRRFGAMMRTATDLATLWLDLVGSAAGGKPPWFPGPPYTGKPAAGPGTVPAPPFSMGVGTDSGGTKSQTEHPPASSGGNAVGAAVSIEITSTQRTEVILDLRPRSTVGALRCHDLRSADSGGSRLTGVTIERVPGEDQVFVRLRVPDDHPPGLYTGLILDDRTSLPCGTLAVRVATSTPT